MAPGTRFALGLVLAAATATLTACATATPPSRPIITSPVAVTTTTARSAPATTPSAPAPAPDGKITMNQLRGHKVKIPDWRFRGCASGSQTLHTKDWRSDTSQFKLRVIKVVYTNLDGDDALETAAWIPATSGRPIRVRSSHSTATGPATSSRSGRSSPDSSGISRRTAVAA